ncbi:MAG TPA: phosphatase PAP2 family protein [Bacteroidia bacterium]|nr:phosphatase PAP2 family protein [Bacteroidia bacterium]
MRYRLFFLVCLLSGSNGFSQDATILHSYPATTYLKSYVTDGCSLLAAPAHWDNKDLLLFMGVVTTTGIAMYYDEQIQRSMLGNDGIFGFSALKLDNLGNGMYSIPLLAGIFASGKIGKNPYDCEVALLGLKVFVLNGIYTRGIKYTYQRHGPGDNMPPDAFWFEGPAHGITGYNSFVSGHASSAFALAAVLSKAYKPKHKWVPWIAYPLASLVAFSRVYDNKHWASDAVAGAAFGYFSGLFLYRINIGK